MALVRELFRCTRFSFLPVRFQWRSLSAPASAYVFHPRMQTMEADVQMFQWTKTQQLEHRPRALKELRNSLNLTSFLSLIEKSIIVARSFETQEEYTPKTYPFGLIQNFLKIVLTNARWYPQLRNLHIAHEPNIAATWVHGNQTLAVRGRAGTFLTSREKLPQFYDNSTVEESQKYELDSMSPISPYINLSQHSVNNENSTGFWRGRSFPYLHTLIVIDNQAIPEIQLIQKGLVYLFSCLLSQATEKHGNEIVGKTLPEAECAQCIVTNGKRFSFLLYQLNTLDIKDVNSGVKNLVHIERPGLLYSKIEKQKDRWNFGYKRVVDLNEDVLRTLLSVLLLS